MYVAIFRINIFLYKELKVFLMAHFCIALIRVSKDSNCMCSYSQNTYAQKIQFTRRGMLLVVRIQFPLCCFLHSHIVQIGFRSGGLRGQFIIEIYCRMIILKLTYGVMLSSYNLKSLSVSIPNEGRKCLFNIF